MFAVIIVGISLMILLLVLSRTNKIIYAVAGMLMSCVLLTFFAMIYSLNFSYDTQGMSIDYIMAHFFYAKLTLNKAVMGYNLCLSLTMFVSAVSVIYVVDERKSFIYCLLIPCVAFYIWLLPSTALGIYLSNPIEQAEIFKIGNGIAEAIFWIYIFLPFVILLKNIISSKIYLRQRALIIFGVCMILMDILIVWVFRFGRFSNIWFSKLEYIKIPLNAGNITLSVMTPFIASFILAAIGVLLLFFGPFRLFSVFWRNKLRWNEEPINKNIRMRLHSYKNAFIALRQQVNLIRFYIECGDSEHIDSGLGRCYSIIDENVTALEKTLLLLQDNDVFKSEFNLCDCINEAIKKSIGNDSEVFIYGNFKEVSSIILYGYKADIIECFTNIMINASEAATVIGRNLRLEINIFSEGNYNMVEIKDNGCGIEKENINRIFEAFYSTKPKNHSGGVGLHYVKNVIRAHNGSIRVLSVPGEYAKFQIVFDTDKRYRRIYYKIGAAKKGKALTTGR